MSNGYMAFVTLALPQFLKLGLNLITTQSRGTARTNDAFVCNESILDTSFQGMSIASENQAKDVRQPTEVSPVDSGVENENPVPHIEMEPSIRLNIVREAPEYDAKGYDDCGFDRSLNNAEHYRAEVVEMNKLLYKARGEREKGNIKYSLSDCREAMERGLRCVYEHNISKLFGYMKPGYLIERCKPYIDRRLYGYIRRDYDVASSKQHPGCAGIITKEQANKCWITTKNLSRFIESYY